MRGAVFEPVGPGFGLGELDVDVGELRFSDVDILAGPRELFVGRILFSLCPGEVRVQAVSLIGDARLVLLVLLRLVPGGLELRDSGGELASQSTVFLCRGGLFGEELGHLLVGIRRGFDRAARLLLEEPVSGGDARELLAKGRELRLQKRRALARLRLCPSRGVESSAGLLRRLRRGGFALRRSRELRRGRLRLSPGGVQGLRDDVAIARGVLRLAERVLDRAGGFGLRGGHRGVDVAYAIAHGSHQSLGALGKVLRHRDLRLEVVLGVLRGELHGDEFLVLGVKVHRRRRVTAAVWLFGSRGRVGRDGGRHGLALGARRGVVRGGILLALAARLVGYGWERRGVRVGYGVGSRARAAGGRFGNRVG